MLQESALSAGTPKFQLGGIKTPSADGNSFSPAVKVYQRTIEFLSIELPAI